jgi:hypothetical protein
MSTHRRAILAVIAATSLPLVAPAASSANSLLSGYGGPGQGSQAILGSGLINGGGGSGGSGGSRGSGSGTSGAGESGPSTAAGEGQGAGTAVKPARRRAPSPARRRRAAPVAVGGSSSAAAPAAYPSSAESGSRTAAVASDPLGISGADLVYVLVAVGALGLTGLVTRQLTQTAKKSPTA